MEEEAEQAADVWEKKYIWLSPSFGSMATPLQSLLRETCQDEELPQEGLDIRINCLEPEQWSKYARHRRWTEQTHEQPHCWSALPKWEHT